MKVQAFGINILYILYHGLLYKSLSFWENFGLAIIIVTIIIRLIILPLMIKQTKSSKAMQAIQPEMKELKEKYSSKDQKHNKNYSKKRWQLFQKYDVNPLAGCFPIFVQMPILIGILPCNHENERNC